MKLLFIAPSAYLLGGVQDWLAQLVPALRRLGAEVVVAVPQGDQHDHGRFRAAFPELHAIPFHNPTGSRAGRLRCLSELLAQQSPDLAIGVNIADLYPAVRTTRGDGRFRGRLVMTIHAIESAFYSDLASQRGVIDAVIATNRLSCQLAGALSGMPAERIFYAPYGVPIPERLQPKGSGTTPSQTLHIAWVGRLEQDQKRVHDLPPILRRLDDVGVPYHLSIAGDGPERDRLLEALQPWLRRGVVRFLGRLGKDDLQRQVFQRHHALLITSSWETGPIVAWEAVAAGMVVVSSVYVGCGLEGALVEGRTALMFPVGDAATAAAQLTRLHRDPHLRQRLRHEAFSMVSERYSREASHQAWERALRSVLSLPSLPLPAAAHPPPPSGRLDRWLGLSRAETLRRLLHIRFRHATPGGEWPHTLGGVAENDELLTHASRLDRHEELPA